jgi:hypothetical protein
MVDLLPCPLCASTEVEEHANGGGYRIACRACMTETWSDWPEYAVEKWNTRPLSPELRALLLEAAETIAAIRHGPCDDIAQDDQDLAARLRAAAG